MSYSYDNYRSNIIENLKKQYFSIGQQAGFRLKLIDGNKISIANTVEVLLMLEIIYPNYTFKKYSSLSFINFDNILIFLTCRVNKILEYSKKDQRVLDLAYCAIGILILDKNNKLIKKLLDYFTQNENSNGGWGYFISSDEPDLLGTYLVEQFFYKSGTINSHNFPAWLTNLEKNNNGTSFNRLTELNTSNSFSIEALTLFVYISEIYFNTPVDPLYKQYINNFFTNNISWIINAEENKFVIHPISSYTIFAFGLAAELTVDLSNPFYNDIEIFTKFNTNFMVNTIKNIPFALEYSKLIKTVKNCYDPFNKNKSYCLYNQYELDIQLKNICDKIENCQLKIDNIPRNSSIYILIVLFTIAIFYFLIYTFFKYTFPEVEYKEILVYIGAVFIPLLMELLGFFRKFVSFILKICDTIIKRREKNETHNKN